MIRLPHIVALLALAIALGVNVLAWTAQVRAQAQNRAGLVVQMADGSLITRCVSFSEESLSGYELLRRAKLPLAVEVSGMGPAVCKIGDTGCNYPQQSCFCQCNTLDASCTYWAYAQLKDGAWRASPLGAAGSKVRAGDVDGWRWGKGDGASNENPPIIAFDEICSSAASTPAATQPATALPSPTTVQPAATPAPTSSPLPSATAAPSPTREPATTATAEPTQTPLPSATAAPSPTREPATTATAEPAQTPLPKESTPTATSMPEATATPAPQPDATVSDNALPLLGFGAIAVILVIGYALVRRRGGA